ncbi:olfactory receptor 13A1-like [Leptodactylus fuscus]|uniref:olfactory receptor 13A1-like n=1 Tax=Leptodactylus fuscus TaxID=238119 RepID=UPI003F4F1D19
MVITLVSYSRNLHSPKYFFLTQLTTSDVLTTLDIVPNMLRMTLNNGSSISLLGRITRLFFSSYSECAECLLLTLMSSARYLAICKPLNYHSKFVLKYFISWLSRFIPVLIKSISQQPLFLQISCSDTKNLEVLVMIAVMAVVFTQLLFVVATYICIFMAILKISSTHGRQKVFSTCSSHLIVVSAYYGTLVTVYITPSRRYSVNLSKILSLLNTVITPLCNPIIYTLRNREIRIALSKNVFQKKLL